MLTFIGLLIIGVIVWLLLTDDGKSVAHHRINLGAAVWGVAGGV